MGVPEIEAHVFGSLLAGKKAKGKAKGDQSKSSGRHRGSKFLLKIKVIKT
jgi:hypothetical protein